MTHDILIVDDEADIRMVMTGILSDEGHTTRENGDSTGALEAVRSRLPGLVILDIWLQNSALDGLELLKVLMGEYPSLPVVMISGHGTIEMAVNAIKQGAYDFIEKPFKADRLLLVVERAIEAARLKQENAELRLRAGPAGDLIGRSSPMHQLRQAKAEPKLGAEMDSHADTGVGDIGCEPVETILQLLPSLRSVLGAVVRREHDVVDPFVVRTA